MRLTFTLLFLITGILFCSGQVLHFDIIKGNKTIGNLTASKTARGGMEVIKIESSVEYRILLLLSVNFKLEEEYRNGVLQRGNASNTLNGVTQKESSIEKTGDKYLVKIGGTPSELSDQIDYSIAQIYFKEPNDVKVAFSQHFGQFMEFENLGSNKYKLISPDGENYYTYQNGICTQVEIYRDFGHLTFKMQPDTYARVKSRADTVNIK